ncbi:MAG TPA: ATP-binding protein [Anaerolineaceae bacterium]|nr:ATP-binding protein [Anaerolineaceae bacterium]
MAHSAEYIQRLERLLEVTRNLSANLDLEPFLQSIIEVASELTYCQDSSILAYDEECGCLRFLAAPWYELDALKPLKIPVEQSVAGWVYSHSQPLVVQDASQDPRVDRNADKKLTFETGSILAVPLIFRGETIGVLEAVNKTGKAHYTEDDITILETLASQAALAIQSSRLVQKSQQAYQQLIELDRMKDDFIAITSHELRTPLGLILGHANFLLDGATEEQKEQLDIILKSAMRLKEIIEDFSNADNFKNGVARVRHRKISIDRLIQEIVLSFKDLAERKKISLRTDVSRANLSIEGDAEKIGMALSNLVKNALTFTNEGGHVLVSAEQLPGYVKVMVTDDGIGIPAKDIQSIFERFYQVEQHLTRRHGGMGLGLSIARDLIEAHGGRIWVESVEGKGSRFSFILPHNLSQVSAAEKVFTS